MQAYIVSAIADIFRLYKGLTVVSYYLVSYIVTFTGYNHVSLYGDFSFMYTLGWLYQRVNRISI